MIVAVQTGRYVIRNVDSRLAAAATAGAAAGAVGPYADELDVLLEVLKRGYNISGAVDTPAAERVAALRGGLRGRDRVAAAHFDLGRSRSSTCVGRNIARYFIGDIAEFAVRGLERERVGNGLFIDRIFVCVVAVVRRVAVPALVGIVRQLFLAVVIPAYDRIAAVVQYPVFADRGKGEGAGVGYGVFVSVHAVAGSVVDVIASNASAVVVYLGIGGNGNITAVLNTAAVQSLAAVVCDSCTLADVERTVVVDSGNGVVDQIYRCTVSKGDVCGIGIVVIIYGESADGTIIGIIQIFARAGDSECRAVLYVDIAAVEEDTGRVIVLHRQRRTVFHRQHIGLVVAGNTVIVAADFCRRIIKRQRASNQTLIGAVQNTESRTSDGRNKTSHAVDCRIFNQKMRVVFDVQKCVIFSHHCRIGCVPNGQLRAAIYIDDSIRRGINTVGFDGAGAAFV